MEEEPDLMTSKLPLPWNKLFKRWRFKVPYLCFGQETDFISELPDSLLIHILSKLELLNAVRTCVLSKRWRYVWTTMPNLCFNMDEFVENKWGTGIGRFHWCDLGLEFSKYIDTVMSLRNRSTSDIHTFRICVNSSADYDSGLFSFEAIERWLNILVQHDVVVLDITIGCEYIVLPPSLLNCNSLETLSINLCLSMAELTLGLPNINLPALRKLHLQDITFRSEDMSNFISSSPVLETLEIENCEMTTYNLIIDAPNLKHLRIHLSKNIFRPEFAYREISVFAPMLESFSCEEKWIMGDYSLSNVCPIVRAGMNLLWCHCFNENEWVDLLLCNVSNGLAQFSKVKALYLALPDWLLQWSHVTGEQVKLSSVDEECLLTKLPLECISHNLKFVELGGSEALGLENEFAFVKFLLQNALVLETLNFHHEQERERSRVSTFLKEVEKIARASPNVTISLLEWHHRSKL